MNRTMIDTPNGAVAAHLLESETLVADVKRDFAHAAISPKMKALLAIAGNVRESGKNVTAEDVQKARDEGASDLDLHDTVLIAAAFSMFNRYVDGLATVAPEDPEFYRSRAAKLAADGYRGTNADITAADDPRAINVFLLVHLQCRKHERKDEIKEERRRQHRGPGQRGLRHQCRHQG